MNVGTARSWDAENRLTSITKDGTTTTFAYDGDGARIKQTVNGITTIYVNQFYQKTGDNVTTNYYLGSQLIAVRNAGVLSYIHQDSQGSTSVTSNSAGTATSTLKYLPFGSTRSSTGALPTDREFTGQILDQTGLYYYNARYYDPAIGRFISPDTIIPHFGDSQSLNRYSYCRNNPLKYIDPSGHDDQDGDGYDDDTGDYTGTGYVYHTTSSSPVMTSSDSEISPDKATTIVLAPVSFSAYRPNLFSSFSGGHTGGILVSSIVINAHVRIEDSYVSVSLSGEWFEGLTQNNSPAYFMTQESVLSWKTLDGQKGSIQLITKYFLDPNSNQYASNKEGCFCSIQTSGSNPIPLLKDCYSMDLKIKVIIIDSYSHEWNVEEGGAFIRPGCEAQIRSIKNGNPAWWPNTPGWWPK
jgi:RHS repeat-associated protein